MNKGSRRYAFIGLLISALAFLTILGVLAIRAFEAFSLYTPPDPTMLDRILYIAIAVFIAGYAIFALLDPDRVRKFFSGRQMKYGSNSLILFLAFLGILIVINMLANQYPKRWDVTEDKQHTLAPESIAALEELPEPVLATAFYSTRLNAGSADELLHDYKNFSNGKFDYKFMNPDANPVLAKQLGITGDGKILLQMGESQEIVTLASERELTGGLIRLLNPDKPVLYFLIGEGEHDTENPDQTAYTRVRQVLESQNYVVKSLNLQAEGSIPDDADAIVIAGPIVPLADKAVTLIGDYLDNEGSLLVMANPVPLTDFGDKSDPLAGYLARDWGLTLDDDIVVDTNSPSSPFFAVGAQYGSHPITEKMQGIAAIFPYARSLTISDGFTDATLTPLVYTIDRSWGETNYAALETETLAYDEGVDSPGPMLLAAAAVNTTTNSRVVVFGSSSFAQDENFDFSGNGDLAINSIDWLVEKENLIGITEGETINRTFNPPDSLKFILLIISSTCLIPMVVIGAGFYTWIIRRRRG